MQGTLERKQRNDTMLSSTIQGNDITLKTLVTSMVTNLASNAVEQKIKGTPEKPDTDQNNNNSTKPWDLFAFMSGLFSLAAVKREQEEREQIQEENEADANDNSTWGDDELSVSNPQPISNQQAIELSQQNPHGNNGQTATMNSATYGVSITEEDVALGLGEHITFMADAEGDIANPHLNQTPSYGHGTDGVSSAEAYDILFGTGGMLDETGVQSTFNLDVNEDVEASGGVVNDENGRRNPYIPANYLNVTRQASVETENNSGNEDSSSGNNDPAQIEPNTMGVGITQEEYDLLFGNPNIIDAETPLNLDIPQFRIYAYNPGRFSTGLFGGVFAGALNKWYNYKNYWWPGHGAVRTGNRDIGAYPNRYTSYNRGWKDEGAFVNGQDASGQQNVYSIDITAEEVGRLELNKKFKVDYNLVLSNCIGFDRDMAERIGIDIPSFGFMDTPAALTEWVKIQKNERIVNTLAGYSWEVENKGLKPLALMDTASHFDASVRADIARYKNFSFYGEAGLRDFNQYSFGAGLEYKNFGLIPSVFGDVGYINDINNPDSIRLRAGMDISLIQAAVRLRGTVSQNYYFNQGAWGNRKWELGVHYQF